MNNEYNNMNNQYGNMNNQYGYPNNQQFPGAMPPVGVNGAKKNGLSTGAIVGIIVGVVAIIAVVVLVLLMNGTNSMDITGNWNCTGSDGDATILITEDGKVSITTVQYGMTLTLAGDYKELSKNYNPTASKSGYNYAQYRIDNGSVTNGENTVPLDSSQTYGFIFGLTSDGESAHYIDSDSTGALQYVCTKK